MIPYIMQKLRNLRNAGQDKKLYDSVVNLNIMISEPTIQASVISGLANSGTLAGLKMEKATEREAALTYLKFMQLYDETLLIKINSFNSLIEFQFTLFQRAQNNFSMRYANSSSVFVNPGKPHYQSDIINTLNQVFDKANNKPHFTIVSNKTNTANFLTTEDTLLLEPIVEDTSPEDDRIYFWRQDTADKNRAHVEVSKKDQMLARLAPGDYTLYFYVCNNINCSRTDTVHFTVYTKPTLKVQRRPGKFPFKFQPDRLIIQEYLLNDKTIEDFTAYQVSLNRTGFANPLQPLALCIKVSDKKGETYVDKELYFSSQTPDSMVINHGKENAIVDSINSMNHPFQSIRLNKFQVAFKTKSANMQSVEQKRDLTVFERRAVNLVYDAAFSPLPKNQLFDSWLNVAAGLDIRMTNFLFVTALVGTNAANNSFHHYYGNFTAYFIFFRNRLEGGPSVFIADDDKTVSLGFRIAYSFFQNGRNKLKIGDSYYNRGNSDYYSLHYTGDIFFNH